jgi:putative ABC transport system permease protein
MRLSRLVLRGLVSGTGTQRLLVPLCALGVALGVGVVVGVDVANESARRSMRLSATAMSGPATLHIVSASGRIPEAVYTGLRVQHGIRNIAPVVEGVVTALGGAGGRLRVLGVDPFARQADAAAEPTQDIARILQPGSVALSEPLSNRLGVREGGSLAVTSDAGVAHLTVTTVYTPASTAANEASADLLLVDVSTAQQVLGSLGFLTRIEVMPSETGDASRLRALLPPGTALVPASSRADTLDAMTRAFRTNLTAMSLLALVFGVYLVYSAVSFSVVRRRPLIATLRALGVTPGEVRAALAAEALAIGVVGSALGLALGRVGGGGLVHLVTRTISDLYFAAEVRAVSLHASTVAKGVALGIGGVLLAAAPAVHSATNTPPAEAMRRTALEAVTRHRATRAACAGVALVAMGVALLAVPGERLSMGFAALFMLLVGASMVVPLAAWLAAEATAPAAGRVFGTVGRLAVSGVSGSLSRTGVALAALMAAVAVTLAVDAMIGSMRGTVMSWLSATLQADVYVSASGDAATIPQPFIESLRKQADIGYVSTYQRREAITPSGPVALVAVSIEERGRGAYRFVDRGAEDIWGAFEAGAGVLVSEPLAYRRSLAAGSSLRLLTDAGDRDFEVLGVYYDYGSTDGEATIAQSAYDQLWASDGITALGVYVRQGAEAPAVSAAVRDLAANMGVDARVRTNRALRDAAVEVFERTFAITSVLRALTGIVAFVGVFAALMAQQIEKRREYAVLRAVGVTPGQVFGIVGVQTAFLGLAAGLIALPVGSALAAVMVHVINRRSFGWTIELAVEPAALTRGVAIAVLAAVAAGIYPAARMAWSPPSAALREE